MASIKTLDDALVEKIIAKVRDFAEEIAETKLYPYQRPFFDRIVRSVLTNDSAELTALFSRQSGKSQTTAQAIASLMILLPLLAQKFPELSLFKKGAWVGIFAPTNEQAITLFDRVYSCFTTDTAVNILTSPDFNLGIPAKGGSRGNLIKLPNGSFCRYQSANNRSNIESKTYHIIFIDECQDVGSFKIRKSIGPMGAAVNASVVLTGTPNIIIGHFYHAIEKNKTVDMDIKHQKYKHHFEADRFEVEKYNPYYKKYMKKELGRLGEESDEYQMAYLLRWPKERGMMFTKGMLEKRAYNRSTKIRLDYKEAACIAGLDLGKNIDSTVLTILTADWEHPDEQGNVNKQLLDWLELEGDDWESQYEIVVEKLSHYQIETLVIDSTGVGSPITERYMYLLPNVNVAPFIFTAQSKDIGYKYLLQEIKAGRLLIPANADIRETKRFKKFEFQMTNLAKIYSGKYLNPRAAEEDGHDDYPDSLMMCCYGTYFDVMPEVDVGEANIFVSDRQVTDIWGRPYSRPKERKFGRY